MLINCLCLSVRLPVKSRLLVVKFLGEELKITHGFSTVQVVSTPKPHVVQRSLYYIVVLYVLHCCILCQLHFNKISQIKAALI